MKIEFIPFEPNHRHSKHLLSILKYANILASNAHFNSMMNGMASDPQINLDLNLNLSVKVEITYDMRGYERNAHSITILKSHVILNQTLFDRIEMHHSNKEEYLIKVFLAFSLAAHESGHVIVRQNHHEVKKDDPITPEKFNLVFVSGGKEAGRYLENLIYGGILHFVCRKGIRWNSQNNVKVIRLMILTAFGEKEVDDTMLISAFQEGKVIEMPTGNPFILNSNEVVLRPFGGKFQPRIQHSAYKSKKCGNI
jgi:hypothetical protein